MSRGKREKRRKRLEFFQLIVFLSWLAGVAWVTASYFLAFLSRDVNQAVTLAVITEVLGVTIAYAVYQGKLKTSLNKHGLTVDKDGSVHKVDNDMSGV